MQGIIQTIIFVLLPVGAFFIAGINPFRRKAYISMSKQIQEKKLKFVDERFDRLGWRDRLYTITKNTVTMGGSSMRTFVCLIVFAFFAGTGLGHMLFTDTFLAVAAGLAVIPVPYIFLKVKSRWYKRSQDELLENPMGLITNSYISGNDPAILKTE